jgi:hypothetical protein
VIGEQDVNFNREMLQFGNSNDFCSGGAPAATVAGYSDSAIGHASCKIGAWFKHRWK